MSRIESRAKNDLFVSGVSMDEVTDEANISRSMVMGTLDELASTAEYATFYNLLIGSERVVELDGNRRMVTLYPSDFVTIEQRIGLGMLATACFYQPEGEAMGLRGTSVIDSVHGKVRILLSGNVPEALIGEKVFDLTDNTKVYYLDILGVVPESRGRGAGGVLGKASLNEVLDSGVGRVIYVSRTQNPMLVGAVRRLLPEGVGLMPFWEEPNDVVKRAVNWLVEGGHVSRNTRPDSSFNADESFLAWGAYGRVGDGSTWENMLRGYEKEIDWDGEVAVAMSGYLESLGTGWEEALVRGHAFVIAAMIDKNE